MEMKERWDGGFCGLWLGAEGFFSWMELWRRVLKGEVCMGTGLVGDGEWAARLVDGFFWIKMFLRTRISGISWKWPQKRWHCSKKFAL